MVNLSYISYNKPTIYSNTKIMYFKMIKQTKILILGWKIIY